MLLATPLLRERFHMFPFIRILEACHVPYHVRHATLVWNLMNHIGSDHWWPRRAGGKIDILFMPPIRGTTRPLRMYMVSYIYKIITTLSAAGGRSMASLVCSAYPVYLLVLFCSYSLMDTSCFYRTGTSGFDNNDNDFWWLVQF